MNDTDGSLRTVLWQMYQEHCSQGRHHESQRSSVVSMIIAVAAAVIGIISFDKSIAGPADIPLTLLLIVLGVFGAGFSMKHYERFSLHMERARRHRDALDTLLPGAPLPLQNLRLAADSAHNKKFPRMRRWRLHYWWLTLSLLVAFLGVALLVTATWFPIKAP